MNFRKRYSFARLVAFGLGLMSCGAATITNGPVAAYILLEGSYLTDDCPVCGRPTILQPMRGTFELVLQEENPLFSRYLVRNVSFQAGIPGGIYYKVKGEGSYQIGGEVAIQQQMTLQADINNGYTNKLCYFTNTIEAIERRWPMIQISLVQTNGTFTQVYQLDLVAAPVREIWFSTTSAFTSGKWQTPTNHVSGGDLISSVGRVVKRNFDLTRNLGLMPLPVDVGLDAVDVIAGGEIVFSLSQDVFSETLGFLHHGDLLSDRGKVVRRNQQLMSAFAPASTNDLGLDAVQMMGDGQILFSITTNVISANTGMTLSRGDILSDRGQVFRTHQQLLARFHPSQTNTDFGLDALYVWPGGEIWFSTEEGFQDAFLGPILPGDLLSDGGYRVFGNLELVSAFAPVEDASNFGLDALFIVTDFTPPAPAPRLLGIDPHLGGPVSWEGQGKVFQLERASALAGPFIPISPIISDSTFTDILPTQPQFFYRLRQW